MLELVITARYLILRLLDQVYYLSKYISFYFCGVGEGIPFLPSFIHRFDLAAMDA